MKRKKKKPSQRKWLEYKVMRLLYWDSKTWNTLQNELNIQDPRILVNAISKLRKHYDITGKKIVISKEPVSMIDEKKIQADVLGIPVKEKIKTQTKYKLTDRGRDKLAYFEARYRFHEKWIPPLEKGKWHNDYVNEIAEYIKNKFY